jgi:PaRep2b protein.
MKKVEELADELKSWIGPEKMGDVEREGLVGRMLGELALLAHYAEAKRGKNDGTWREERVRRLAKAVEMLSGGRIAGDYADKLAQAIVYYAEGYKKYAKKNIESLAGKVGVSMEEVWGVIEFVLSDMYCLARDCARDEVVRKFVEPALELIMLDKALRGKFDGGKALRIFGEMCATAIAGDGTVGPNIVMLTVGGELGGGAALLRLAALYLLNELLPKESAFNVRVYIGEGRYYRITASGENAARFMRLLAVTAPTAGGEYLSPKFEEFVKEARVEVRPGGIRRTDDGNVAADLIISEAGVAVKYNVYLRETDILLQFRSTDRSRVEPAAQLLKLAGVGAEVKREGDEGEWYVKATTDKLAAGGEELRKALAEVVKMAIKNGWVDASKAKRWLKKLEKGRVLMEGWPKYEVRLVEGALVVSFRSTNLDNIKQETQRFREMGLEEGKHFTVKMPEGGREGYVYIRREGLERAAWLSVRGKDEQQRRLAAKFVELILQRAKEACGGAEPCAVYEKAEEIVERGKAWGSLTLKDFENKVEVNGKTYVVKVRGGEAVEEDRGGRKLLRIKIRAEVGRVEGGHTVVDRVVREYTITFSRRGADNAAVGYATARADAPGGRKADAERFSALIKALTGREPRIIEKNDGTIEAVSGSAHLKGFMRYAELADAIEKWLEETGR